MELVPPGISWAKARRRQLGKPTGTTPQNRGRFLGYDVLGQIDDWDDVTKGAVLSRLAPQEDLRFFSPDEEPTAQALLDLILDQDSEPRVPVLHLVDSRLALNRTDGFRYEDMPEDREAWHRSLAYLDQVAQAQHGARFGDCSRTEQMALIQQVQDAEPNKWPDDDGLPAKHVWSLWTRYAATAFYSHPWAWNEIGFGGPAYPRGYKNLGYDARENWEQPEQDARDPITWGNRVEAARRRHLENKGG